MAKDNGTENGVIEFDLGELKKIKAREMASLVKGTDIEATARVLARVVKSCPYGDAFNPDTYLDLPYNDGEGSFISVVNALGEALKNGQRS
jgi:hypothetical protein